MIMPGRFKKFWDTKFTAFENSLEKIHGKKLNKILNDSHRYTKLSNECAALDKAWGATVAARQKGPKTFEKAIKKVFMSARLTVEMSVKILGDAAAKSEKNFRSTKDPKSANELSLVAKHAASIVARAEAAQADFEKELAEMKNKWSLTSNKKTRDAKELVAKRRAMKKHVGSELKNALAWIKAQEMKPDVISYNAGVHESAEEMRRYMKQYLGSLEKNSNDAKELVKALKPLEEWNKKKMLPAKTDEQKKRFDHVIVALGEMKPLMKGVAKWVATL